MRKEKMLAQLEASFGRRPDEEYFTEDIQGIRLHYEQRKEQGLDDFYIDDITWNDLALHEVFKRLNATHCNSGEQLLYYMLRTPVLTPEAFAERKQRIATMVRNPTLRLQLQYILHRLGKRRGTNSRASFLPTLAPEMILVISIGLVLGLILSIVAVALSILSGTFIWIFLIGNPLFHALMMHQLESELVAINYTVAMVGAGRSIEQLRPPELEDSLQDFYAASRKTRSIARMQGVSSATSSELALIINLFFLVDLITYSRLKRKLAKYHAEIAIIREGIGMLDASIAVASFQQGRETCAPEIDFAAAHSFLDVQDMRHPLLDEAVPNSIDIGTPVLVTGSNASGKSTFLKALLLNAVLAQSVCTATCGAYRASAFYLYSSMAIADNVLEGDSYFIAEIKSIKRIVDAVARGERVLCVIDEVLRGTNTVERIAASSELLGDLARPGVLCLAATHDVELCAMLPAYRQVHFEERVQGNEVLFDYQLREGPATTRNAIKLLSMLGFDEALVSRANEKAARYMQRGRWDA